MEQIETGTVLVVQLLRVAFTGVAQDRHRPALLPLEPRSVHQVPVQGWSRHRKACANVRLI